MTLDAVRMAIVGISGRKLPCGEAVSGIRASPINRQYHWSIARCLRHALQLYRCSRGGVYTSVCVWRWLLIAGGIQYSMWDVDKMSNGAA